MYSVSQAHKLAPPGMGATAQSLLEGVHWGLGMSTGSLLGGFMYKELGAVNTFYISAGASPVVCSVNFVSRERQVRVLCWFSKTVRFINHSCPYHFLWVEMCATQVTRN